MIPEPRLSTASGGFAPVARAADMPPGTLISVRAAPAGEQVIVMNVDGEFYALADCCSHESFELSAGELLPDGTIECMWHGARFDCRTGAATHPPAVDSVPVYSVRVEDGVVMLGPRRGPA
jgi:3-phenylpropionate/trans-cinnamate dioxygenase ferredoxin component